MDAIAELAALDWPNAFVVHYADGATERLLCGIGVTLTPPGDDPEGHGGIGAQIPPKHPQNQKRLERYVSLADLEAICSEHGDELWRRSHSR
ncbi:hypothetical protein [Rosistilla oblonga]|uniref:hypothetical protein n=1 Tax=Rosistilla oblonga TaxID=2527990 RepID=UPI00119F3626|nr:hypothetical protein [Rosistilla oblonga]